MSKECTTHHYACDCREEKFKQIEQENAALRADIHAHEQINKQLIEDKRRLDWLARNRSVSSLERPIGVTPESLRASIDAARKEAQP